MILAESMQLFTDNEGKQFPIEINSSFPDIPGTFFSANGLHYFLSPDGDLKLVDQDLVGLKNAKDSSFRWIGINEIRRADMMTLKKGSLVFYKGDRIDPYAKNNSGFFFLLLLLKLI